MNKRFIGYAAAIFAAIGSVNAQADTAMVNSVTFTTTPTNITSFPAAQAFTPTDQSFTVDAQAFTVSFAPVTVNVPTLSQSISQFFPEVTTTTTTGGDYIPHTLPPQYTPIVSTTTTTPSHTQSLDIALNPFSFTLGAVNNVPLNVPCSGSLFCIAAPQPFPDTLAITGNWTFTDTNVSGQQAGSFAEFYKLFDVRGHNSIDLGQWPTSASLQTNVTAVYFLTGATGSVVTPLGSINNYLNYNTSNNDSGIMGIVLSNGSEAPIPLPASAWLMLSSIGGLGVFTRKRKA